MALAPAVLATQPLFSDFAETHLAVLAPLFVELTFAPDEKIFAQGAPAMWVYILRMGQVDLCLHPEDGGYFCIAQVTPNGVFGWSAMLGHKRYTSTAVSATTSQALGVKGHLLRRLLHTDAVLGRLLVSRMAHTVVGRTHSHPDQMARLIEREMALV